MISPFSKPDIGGVESHIDKLTTYLCEKKDVSVTLITYMPLASNEKPLKYEANGNLEIIRMQWFGKGWFRKLEPYFPLNMFYLFPGLFYLALRTYSKRKEEFDVIHAHGFIAGAITKILKLFHHKRAVISTHAIYSLKKGSIKSMLFKWLLTGFDKILAVGEPSRQEIIQLGFQKEKVEVHPNWIDIQSFIPVPQSEARKKLGLDSRSFIVMFIGRMIEIKGELLLLDVAQRANKNITFAFAGSGPTATKIQDAANKCNNIKYLGRLSDEQMKLAYSAADIFASPVLYDEGFATVYLEALACGTPVLTSKKGCLPFFLTDEIAEIIDNMDEVKLLKAIEKHYVSRDLLINKREDCREYAKKHFSEDNAEIIYKSYLASAL
jgi:glycosyltransferase involved in cell wall biosynthesis